MAGKELGRQRFGVRRIERRTATDDVRDQLLSLIEKGDFELGARLPTEHELASLFGVSRPVIREGLGSLRLAGVLESRAGVGTFVRAQRALKGGLLLQGRYSADELHEIRYHLEVPGARLAALRRTAAQVRELSRIVERHQLKTGARAWVKDDLAFHIILAEATGNQLQVRLVAELRELQFEQTVAMADRLGGLAAPEGEHRAILDAVQNRNADGAVAAMRAHLDAILLRARMSVANTSEHEQEVH